MEVHFALVVMLIFGSVSVCYSDENFAQYSAKKKGNFRAIASSSGGHRKGLESDHGSQSSGEQFTSLSNKPRTRRNPPQTPLPSPGQGSPRNGHLNSSSERQREREDGDGNSKPTGKSPKCQPTNGNLISHTNPTELRIKPLADNFTLLMNLKLYCTGDCDGNEFTTGSYYSEFVREDFVREGKKGSVLTIVTKKNGNHWKVFGTVNGKNISISNLGNATTWLSGSSFHSMIISIIPLNGSEWWQRNCTDPKMESSTTETSVEAMSPPSGNSSSLPNISKGEGRERKKEKKELLAILPTASIFATCVICIFINRIKICWR